MIEINRKLYLTEPSNKKSTNYNELKMQIYWYLEAVKKLDY